MINPKKALVYGIIAISFVVMAVTIPTLIRFPGKKEDIKHKVESWFDIVRNMAKVGGIPDIKTEIFIDLHLAIKHKRIVNLNKKILIL